VLQAAENAARTCAAERPMAAQPEPQPTPPSYRTPTRFKCANASTGGDFAVCANPQLMDAMARPEDAYATALFTTHGAIKGSEIEWSKTWGVNCGLPKIGPPCGRPVSGAKLRIQGA
jgi:hypothetical protein